jgi:hypothetical protein
LPQAAELRLDLGLLDGELSLVLQMGVESCSELRQPLPLGIDLLLQHLELTPGGVQ